MRDFYKIFKNKKVLITGHTGFKGSWLTFWLLQLNARICGVSKDIPTKPSLFEALSLRKNIIDKRIDIRDLAKLKKLLIILNQTFYFI